MTIQAEIFTAGIAVVAAVKAAVAKQAAIHCDTFRTFLTMEIFALGAENAHFTYIAPIFGTAFAADVITIRTFGGIVIAGFAGTTVIAFTYGTANAQIAIFAPLTVFAGAFAASAVVFIIARASALIAAVIADAAAVADVVICNKFSAKLAL